MLLPSVFYTETQHAKLSVNVAKGKQKSVMFGYNQIEVEK